MEYRRFKLERFVISSFLVFFFVGRMVFGFLFLVVLVDVLGKESKYFGFKFAESGVGWFYGV